MEYVAIGILALLVVGGGIGMLMMRATAGSTPASPETGDPTALGDTPQHSEGDAAARGPESGAPARDPEEAEGDRFKRDPIGGEAEAEPSIDTGDTPRAG